jgi:hypothetical protein
MCFSETADLAVGGALLPVGGYALTLVRERRDAASRMPGRLIRKLCSTMLNRASG